MDKKILIKYENTFDKLKELYDISYLSTFFLSTKGEIISSYNSNHDWNSLFINEDFNNHCPLMKLGRSLDFKRLGSHIVNWDNVKPTNNEELLVTEARSDFNITTGYSILKNSYQHGQQVFALGKKDRNISFRDIYLMHDIINNTFK